MMLQMPEPSPPPKLSVPWLSIYRQRWHYSRINRFCNLLSKSWQLNWDLIEICACGVVFSTPLSTQISFFQNFRIRAKFHWKSVVFDSSTQNLKTHSNFWCRGVNNKHHARRGGIWNLAFKHHWKIWKLTEIFENSLKNFSEFSNFLVVFQPNSKSHLSAAWCLLYNKLQSWMISKGSTKEMEKFRKKS